MEAIYTDEGRITPNGANYQYEYAIKDHLGNTRITFADLNNNNIVDVPGDILQENHYYPFGMNMNYSWMNNAGLQDTRYQYNGKELNDDYGLNLSDYGARWYDGSVGRWWCVDPKEESYRNWSPYNFGLNNSFRFFDHDGMAANDIFIKPKQGDETKYNSRTLERLQKLTDDKLGFAKDGKTVRIVERREGDKCEGTKLIRDRIESPKVTTTITNDLEGTGRNEEFLNTQAETRASDPKAARDGTGSNSKILYDPDVKANFTTVDGNRETSDPSIVLAHELIHSDNIANGTRDMTPVEGNKLKNKEEIGTVKRENIIRDENKQKLRSDGKN